VMVRAQAMQTLVFATHLRLCLRHGR